jgi:CRP-like cAMP-binding protein
VTFLKNLKDFPSPVTFTAAEQSRLVSWDNDALRRLVADDTEFSMALQASLGLQLAGLLDHAQDGVGFALMSTGAKAGRQGHAAAMVLSQGLDSRRFEARVEHLRLA